MYQTDSGNEILLFHMGTCGLIFKNDLLCVEFQNLGRCYTDEASNSCHDSKFIWGVLKTATAIVIPSKHNYVTRLSYLCLNF